MIQTDFRTGRFRAQTVRQGTPVPRFGATQPAPGGSAPQAPSGDVYVPKKSQTFFAPGTPFFFLHGTSCTGKIVKPITDWVARDTQGPHPMYVSYLPEVEKGTGIQTDGPNRQAAYKMALRDMGDFTSQLIDLNAKKLRPLLEKAQKPGPRDEAYRAIGEYFEVLPAARETVAPIILEHLLKPLFTLPPDLKAVGGVDKPLAALAADNTAKVRRELKKLDVPPSQQNREILDTQLLKVLSDYQGKPLNIDVNHPKANAVNLRPVNFTDVQRIEGYLLYLERNLSQALAQAFASTGQGGSQPQNTGQVERRARQTAAKLMQKLAPRGMAFGHSQGGTVLMLAALRAMEGRTEDFRQALRRTDSVGAAELAGRYMGFAMLVNAPLSGIPDEPAWGKVLLEESVNLSKKVPLLKKDPERVKRWVKSAVWKSYARSLPASVEMRAGSELMQKIRQLLPVIPGYADAKGFSLASVWDAGDIYVESAASKLLDEAEQSVPNVFHVELNAAKIKPRYRSPEELVRSFKPVYGLNTAWFGRQMPEKFKEYAYNLYLEKISGVEQHGVIFSLPDYLNEALGKKLIDDRQNLANAVELSSFEPFRAQTLVARRNILQKRIATQPIQQGVLALNQFMAEHPGFFDELLKNAGEAVPLRDSASFQAALVVEATLDILAKALAQPGLKAQYGRVIRVHLKKIAEADIAYSTRETPGAASISQQARQVMENNND